MKERGGKDDDIGGKVRKKYRVNGRILNESKKNK